MHDAAFDRLLLSSTLAEIPHKLGVVATAPKGLTQRELRSLVAMASGLALSEEGADRRQAFEIASRVAQVTSNQSIAVACQALLARLGNFPGMKLLDKKAQGASPPVLAAWEAQAKRLVNTVHLGQAKHNKVVLTDFQKKVYDALRSAANVSFSGPTSAGKSFVLTLDLVRRLFEAKSTTVYLVPTRALIREVMMRVRESLESYGLDVPVRSIPVPLTPEQAKDGAVFVLTQERLLTLLFSTEGRQPIDVLIVDEAQSIGEAARGVVLHSAIDAALTFNPDLQVYFGCPLASNPHLLVTLFKNERTSTSFIESVSPVTQNVLLVGRVKGQPQQAHLSLLHSNRHLDLGTAELPFRSDAGAIQKTGAPCGTGHK